MTRSRKNHKTRYKKANKKINSKNHILNMKKIGIVMLLILLMLNTLVFTEVVTEGVLRDVFAETEELEDGEPIESPEGEDIGEDDTDTEGEIEEQPGEDTLEDEPGGEDSDLSEEELEEEPDEESLLAMLNNLLMPLGLDEEGIEPLSDSWELFISNSSYEIGVDAINFAVDSQNLNSLVLSGFPIIDGDGSYTYYLVDAPTFVNFNKSQTINDFPSLKEELFTQNSKDTPPETHPLDIRGTSLKQSQAFKCVIVSENTQKIVFSFSNAIIHSIVNFYYNKDEKNNSVTPYFTRDVFYDKDHTLVSMYNPIDSILPAAPSMFRKKFIDWRIFPGGTVVNSSILKDIIEKNSTSNVYATWQDVTNYSLALYQDDSYTTSLGTVLVNNDGTSIWVNDGNVLTSPTGPSGKEGYIFKGWKFTDKSGTEQPIVFGEPNNGQCSINSDTANALWEARDVVNNNTKIYATWEKPESHKFNLVFLNGSGVHKSYFNNAKNQSLSLNGLTTPSKPDGMFVEWRYRNANGEETKLEINNEEISNSEMTNLWNAATYNSRTNNWSTNVNAIFVTNNLTLNFYKDKGDVSPYYQEIVKYDNRNENLYIGDMNSPAKQNYYFTGYWESDTVSGIYITLDPSNGKKYIGNNHVNQLLTSGDYDPESGIIKFYAKWERQKLLLDFYKDGSVFNNNTLIYESTINDKRKTVELGDSVDISDVSSMVSSIKPPQGKEGYIAKYWYYKDKNDKEYPVTINTSSGQSTISANTIKALYDNEDIYINIQSNTNRKVNLYIKWEDPNSGSGNNGGSGGSGGGGSSSGGSSSGGSSSGGSSSGGSSGGSSSKPTKPTQPETNPTPVNPTPTPITPAPVPVIPEAPLVEQIMEPEPPVTTPVRTNRDAEPVNNTTPAAPEETADTEPVVSAGIPANFIHMTSREEINIKGSSLDNTREELFNLVLTSKEQEDVRNGEEIDVWIDIEPLYYIAEEVTKTIEEAASEYTIVAYYDINFLKQIGGADIIAVEEIPGGGVSIRLPIPEELLDEDYTFRIVRLHDGEEPFIIIPEVSGDYLTFVSDRFSTYALVYTEANPVALVPDFDATPVSNTKELSCVILVTILDLLAILTYAMIGFNRNRREAHS